jgi:hypothetical protein
MWLQDRKLQQLSQLGCDAVVFDIALQVMYAAAWFISS